MMKDGWRRTAACAFVAVMVCRLEVALARQAAPEQPAQMSDTVFKNVQVLKGIPVDEFMDTMGMFASSLGFDCISCHAPEISINRAAFARRSANGSSAARRLTTAPCHCCRAPMRDSSR